MQVLRETSTAGPTGSACCVWRSVPYAARGQASARCMGETSKRRFGCGAQRGDLGRDLHAKGRLRFRTRAPGRTLTNKASECTLA